MNMSLSKRDIKLLLILAGILLIVASYYFVYTPTKESREAIEAQNVQLQNQVSCQAALQHYPGIRFRCSFWFSGADQ